MAKTAIISRLSATIQAADLPDAERFVLQRELRALSALNRLISRHKTAKNANLAGNHAAKSAKQPKNVRYKPTKGVWIDGVRCCKLCKKPLPHSTRDEWRFHMLACKRRHMQQASHRYYLAVGYDKLWRTGLIARKRRAVERKTAIFHEIAPRYAALLGPAGVERAILSCVDPKSGEMWGYTMYRRWVRNNFAAPPVVHPT